MRPFTKHLSIAAFGLAVAIGAGSAPAVADNVAITYSAAAVMQPDFSTSPTDLSSICHNAATCDYGIENFQNWTGSSTYSAAFTDGGYQPTGSAVFSGTYAVGTGTTTGTNGEWVSEPQNQFGGVNSNFGYPELFNPAAASNHGTAATATYTLSVNHTAAVPGANYFGIWISALDANNGLTIYDGSTVVAQFNSQGLLKQLGSCSNPSSNAYCGNPGSGTYHGQDNNELFVYVNVFDLSGYITSVTLSNGGTSGTGFESDNHTLAYINPITVTGTPIPEPATLGIFAAGLTGIFWVRRKATVPISVRRRR